MTRRLSVRPYLSRMANAALAGRDLLSPGVKVLSRPYTYQIEVNNFCNLSCAHCPRRAEHAEINTGRWTMEMLERVMPWMSSAGFVGMAGLGEPFLVQQLPLMLRRIVEAGPAPSVTTNGTLIRGEALEQIVGVGPMLISVSLDGASPETYEPIRLGAKFDQFVENLVALKEAKARAGTRHPTVQLCWTWTHSNLHEAQALAKLAEQAGASMIRTHPIVVDDVPAVAAEAVTDEELAGAIQRLESVLSPAIRHVHVPVRTTESAGLASSNGVRRRYFCPNIWRTMHIGVEGNVRVCCMGAFEDLGNVRDEPLEAIWNAPAMVRLRQALLAGDPPEVCRRCYLLRPYSRQEAGRVLREYKESLYLHSLIIQ